MKQNNRQEKDQNKSTAHKRVGIGDVKFCHCRHPKEGCDKSRKKTTKYPRVRQKLSEKIDFVY